MQKIKPFFESIIISSVLVTALSFCFYLSSAQASYHFSDYNGLPPIHTQNGTTKTPVGITPQEIKKIYNLPATGGHGTVVIVGAYHDTSIESDLAMFNKTFNLPACTTANGCLTVHNMSNSVKSNTDSWSLETSLDVEWAHAIAPQAKILLIEAATQSGANLLKAVDYAAQVKDASAITMSWGGGEFPEETSLDSHFVSVAHAPFFASSGDSGTGASWPASSPNVIGVGGTTLTLTSYGSFKSEGAWSGSGGGVSAYEKEPVYQTGYRIPKAGGMRAIPDVAYDADPHNGFPIYEKGGWHTVGGTSAGAPQWAGIAALGGSFTSVQLYADKSTGQNTKYFRDITSGTNGACGYFCTARSHYDYVTGLGSPQTSNF
jgi:subtilase family serine protease